MLLWWEQTGQGSEENPVLQKTFPLIAREEDLIKETC